MSYKTLFFGTALLLQGILPHAAHAEESILLTFESIFDAEALRCTPSQESYIFALYAKPYEEGEGKAAIQHAGENKAKIGNMVLTGVTSFSITPKKIKYMTELRSLAFSIEKEGIKIVRLTFVEGVDWAGYAYDIDGTDDKIQNFLDKHGLNAPEPEHPIMDVEKTREGVWRITCNTSA